MEQRIRVFAQHPRRRRLGLGIERKEKRRRRGGRVTFVRFFSPSFSTKEENDVLSWREREKGEKRGGGGGTTE